MPVRLSHAMYRQTASVRSLESVNDLGSFHHLPELGTSVNNSREYYKQYRSQNMAPAKLVQNRSLDFTEE